MIGSFYEVEGGASVGEAPPPAGRQNTASREQIPKRSETSRAKEAADDFRFSVDVWTKTYWRRWSNGRSACCYCCCCNRRRKTSLQYQNWSCIPTVGSLNGIHCRHHRCRRCYCCCSYWYWCWYYRRRHQFSSICRMMTMTTITMMKSTVTKVNFCEDQVVA